jgi:hypothetical protein
VPAQRPHEPGLAVHEGVHPAGRERAPRKDVGELLGPVRVAVVPAQVEPAGRVEGLLVGRAVDLDERQRRHPGRDALQRRGNGGQRGLVAHQEMPVGRRVGGVSAAGPEQQQRVARPGGGGPRPGQAGVAVVDEVDRQLARGGIEGADGVGAHCGPLLVGERRPHGVHVERLGIGDAGPREEDLDVPVGVGRVREGGEVVTPGHHADHVRGRPLGAPHLQCGGPAGHGPSRGR